MAEFEITTADTEATLELGARFARALDAVGCPALLVDLQGDLGAGKTVFVRGVARGLGIAPEAEVVSPTFTIARDYAVPAGPIRTLHHLDAYRLRGPEDLEAIGFEEMCGDGCLTCVEWGETVRAALPADRVLVLLAPTAPGPPTEETPPCSPLPPAELPRRVRFRGDGPWGVRVVAALAAGPVEVRGP